MHARCKATVERRDIKPHLSGVTSQVFESQLRRLGKKHVVIFPKFSLILGAACSLRSPPRLRMNRIQGEVPIGKPHLAWIALKQLLECRMSLLAERAFKVGEFHDRHRRVRRTADGSILCGHLNTDCSWRLETDNDPTL